MFLDQANIISTIFKNQLEKKSLINLKYKNKQNQTRKIKNKKIKLINHYKSLSIIKNRKSKFKNKMINI